MSAPSSPAESVCASSRRRVSTNGVEELERFRAAPAADSLRHTRELPAPGGASTPSLFGAHAVLGGARIPLEAPSITMTGNRLSILGADEAKGSDGWLVLSGSLGSASLLLSKLEVRVGGVEQPFRWWHDEGGWVAVGQKANFARSAKSGGATIEISADLQDETGAVVSPIGRLSLGYIGTVENARRLGALGEGQHPWPVCAATVRSGVHLSERFGEAFVESQATMAAIRTPDQLARYHLVIRARFRAGDKPPLRLRVATTGGSVRSMWRVTSNARSQSYAIDVDELDGQPWTVGVDLEDRPISDLDDRLMAWQAVDMRLVEMPVSPKKQVSIRKPIGPKNAVVATGDFETYRGRPMVWLTELVELSVKGRWNFENGSKVTLSGPSYLEPSAIEALVAHLNGVEVVRQSASIGRNRWTWTGAVRTKLPPQIAFGADLRIASPVNQPININDSRRASAMLDRVGFAGAKTSQAVDSGPRNLPDDLQLQGGLFNEEWNAVASGTWLGTEASFRLWLPHSAGQLIVEGDLATSRRAVETLEVLQNGEVCAVSVDLRQDGSWSATASLNQSPPNLSMSLITLKSSGDEDPTFPSVLVSKVSVA